MQRLALPCWTVRVWCKSSIGRLRSVAEVERIVTSAIKRALAQQLAELGAWAGRSAEYAHGRGKSAKGQDLAAVRIHDEWASRFKRVRSGQAKTPPRDTVAAVAQNLPSERR